MPAVEYKKEGKIAIFTLNRPQALNACNVEMLTELRDAMIEFRNDSEAWVGIVTGAGERAFCAGADVNDMIPFLRNNIPTQWQVPAAIFRGLEIWKPLIAAINGIALGGGCEIALACDLRVISETARMGTPEVNLGIIPGWGGTQRLPRLIPWCKAAEILFLGKPIDAQEAYRIGLVNKVVPPDKVMPAAREWADALCQVGPLAVRAAKQAMIQGTSMPLEQGLRLELNLFNQMLLTEDNLEGVKAFNERRKPSFKVK